MRIDDGPFSNGLPPTHPGEHLADDLDKSLAVPPGTISAILEARNGITPVLALRLSHYFGTSARLWMDLQNTYDLKVAIRRCGPEIEKYVQPRLVRRNGR
jgi:addiction module HigA family antidote